MWIKFGNGIGFIWWWLSICQGGGGGCIYTWCILVRISYILKCNVVTMCWKLIDTHQKRQKDDDGWLLLPLCWPKMRKSNHTTCECARRMLQNHIAASTYLYGVYNSSIYNCAIFPLCKLQKREKGIRTFSCVNFFFADTSKCSLRKCQQTW